MSSSTTNKTTASVPDVNADQESQADDSVMSISEESSDLSQSNNDAAVMNDADAAPRNAAAAAGAVDDKKVNAAKPQADAGAEAKDKAEANAKIVRAEASAVNGQSSTPVGGEKESESKGKDSSVPTKIIEVQRNEKIQKDTKATSQIGTGSVSGSAAETKGESRKRKGSPLSGSAQEAKRDRKDNTSSQADDTQGTAAGTKSTDGTSESGSLPSRDTNSSLPVPVVSAISQSPPRKTKKLPALNNESPEKKSPTSPKIGSAQTVSKPLTSSTNEISNGNGNANANASSSTSIPQKVNVQEEKKISDEAMSLPKSLRPEESQIIPTPQESDAEIEPECDAAFRSIVNLDPIPHSPPLPVLTPKEFAQLETALQIGDKYEMMSDNHSWRDDWNGNLQLMDKELVMNKNVVMKNPDAKKVLLPFCDWVAKLARHSEDFTAIKQLFSFVYNMKGTPRMAKRILAHSINRPASSVVERLQFVTDATRRISYDPVVLNQDGWTTVKSDVPDGFTGGSYLIGRRVFWDKFEAIVIAFVRDEDIGDLWKCLWVEDQDTFDLEADELQEGMKKWEKKIAKRKPLKDQAKKRPSARFEGSRNFTISGIEDGIILAKSYKSKSGRPWPARVMHVTEVKALGPQLGSRRSSSKNEIHVVFLAPFWNCENNGSSIPTATSLYATGPLFELETISVSDETILKYPYVKSIDSTLSITDLQTEFNFLGLPKAAFPRFLDAHRMASALKLHAMKENRKKQRMSSIDADATATLTDTHPLSIKTFSFPDPLLNLPFGYILSKFPDLSHRAKPGESDLKEPIMQLKLMLDALVPPNCFGQTVDNSPSPMETPVKTKHPPLNVPNSVGLTPTISPALNASLRATRNDSNGEFNLWDVGSFASDYLIDHIKPSPEGSRSLLHPLYSNLDRIVNALNKMVIDLEEGTDSNLQKRQDMLASIIVQCITAKGHCEDFLFSADLPPSINKRNILLEWRKACERVYKRAIIRLGHIDCGNGVMAVLTDSRCNEHITADGSFERAVRLPAALKGAKNAGVGSRPSLPLVTKIEDEYLTLAEEKILPMAHMASYLKKMKTKISNLPQDAKGVPLTDGSDGEGGEDTMGSKGSFTAAVAGVAAALKGVDMIIGGKCVNAFCAVRPPGHHAGRSLRPMNAISNGFCLLNAAAGAALYAATPRSQGGLGLKRICVIDFDVHHGNGTQDILCSTYDPRFLYVSTHAGGPHINGYEDDSEDDGFRRGLNTKSEGIFPGRCGDTSPHPGVLNVPLGKKVTPSAIGTALVCEVTPKVEEFDPELIIISAGFDAHVNDPLGMGGLTAENFGTVTKVICQMAKKSCSGRVLSILEGGYGVPCCRPLAEDTFLPKAVDGSQLKRLDLGDEIPSDMDDRIDWPLAKKLDKCHQEGFLQCVEEHVRSLALNSNVDVAV